MYDFTYTTSACEKEKKISYTTQQSKCTHLIIKVDFHREDFIRTIRSSKEPGHIYKCQFNERTHKQQQSTGL